MRQDYSYQVVNDESMESAKSIKKGTGSYYTPRPLANLISHDALFRWLSERAATTIKNEQDLKKLKSKTKINLLEKIKHVTILDPAVGEGAFLIAAADLLRNIRIHLGDKETESRIKRSIVEDCLFGVDLAQYATNSCKKLLSEWVSGRETTNTKMNILYGNSLVGYVKVPLDNDAQTIDGLIFDIYPKSSQSNQEKLRKKLEAVKPLHWSLEFPKVFLSRNPGFDIVLGNPPYGSILGEVERRFISKKYPQNVGGGRNGSWNSAAHFLVRTSSLMKNGGQLGFLVPNSFLRVKQFSKTREFLLNSSKLWKIVDEGSPFDDVTLEMVSLFCEQVQAEGEYEIEVESRRYGFEQANTVSSRVFRESRIFPIYHDQILAKILQRGQKHLLLAGRGRDIPKEHVRMKQSPKFKTPYITSGRSVKRYSLNSKHVFYTDDWFLQDSGLRDSFENEYLVATKNYRYPRCILKPRGTIHGGGIVKITPLYENADLRVLGLILNSKLVRQISIRYLTNYSQLTCCLNTGIMEELPIVLPKQPRIYGELFDLFSRLYASEEETSGSVYIPPLERLADALIYSLYFGDDSLEQRVNRCVTDLTSLTEDQEIVELVKGVFNEPSVIHLEKLGVFPATRKLRRY
ncbi:MAG: Eco57I restriction-modification methylase domain-containing protein [Promethearchaeota archaeon]